MYVHKESAISGMTYFWDKAGLGIREAVNITNPQEANLLKKLFFIYVQLRVAYE